MRILLLDIETAPKRAFVWGVWKERVNPNQLLTDWYMLSWSAKWLGDTEVLGQHIHPLKVLEEDDKLLLLQLRELMEEADVIVAHNANKFDIPSINTRMLCNGLTPPTPSRVIDTLTVAKRKFKFTYNRLDYIGKVLGVGRKIDTGGFDLWERCLKAEEKALDEMLEYNKQDVLLLEEVYLKLRPYVNNHPNFNITSSSPVCPSCGSAAVIKKGYHHTNVSTFQRYKCKDCGAPSRARINLKDKGGMKDMLIGVVT